MLLYALYLSLSLVSDLSIGALPFNTNFFIRIYLFRKGSNAIDKQYNAGQCRYYNPHNTL
jgi:hypothetical protein